MKKINVSNLIDLRTREQETVNNIARYQSLGDWYKNRLQAERDHLAEIRSEMHEASEKLLSAIAEAEGTRTSARKISTLDILDDLIAINDYLGISKKNLKGTTVTVNHHAQSFPGAYKGTPESTYFCAEFTSGWFVTAIYRGTCGTQKYNLQLSDTAKAEYLNNAVTLK